MSSLQTHQVWMRQVPEVVKALDGIATQLMYLNALVFVVGFFIVVFI